MAEKSEPKFAIGDVVTDKNRNMGMVKAITPYNIPGKPTFYIVTYGITDIWRRDAPEDELTLYAPAERLDDERTNDFWR